VAKRDGFWSYSFTIIALPLRKCWVKRVHSGLRFLRYLVSDLYDRAFQKLNGRNSPPSSYNSLRKKPFSLARRRQMNLVQWVFIGRAGLFRN
jgi:hypothetical protein